MWFAVVTVQGDIKNIVKREGHRVCFHGTMLTNTVIKAGVNMNLSEILGSLKRDWKGKKRQLPDATTAPQVGGQLFGVHLPICNFKF